jgi:CRP-like cAMP-binding protein
MTTPEPSVLQAVRHSRLALDLDADQSAVLAGLLTLQSYEPQQLLAAEGQTDNRLYAVVDGSLGVVKHRGTPDETLLAQLKPGEFAHELGFLDGAPRYASLVALEKSQALVLEREKLESLIDTHPRVLYRVMCAIVQAVHRVQTRLSMQALELTNYVYKQHGRY